MPLLYPLNKLNKIQYQVALWVLGAFCTLPIMEIKAIVGLCYKTSVWTDFGRVRVRTDIGQ